MRSKALVRALALAALALLVAGVGVAPGADRNTGDIALEYVKANKQALGLTGADINDLIVQDTVDSAHTGVTHVYLIQRHRDIDVHDAIVNVNVAKNGTIISSGSRAVENLAAAVAGQNASKDAVEAVGAAIGGVGVKAKKPLSVVDRKGGAKQKTVVSDAGIASRPIEAELRWLPRGNGSVRLAWYVSVELENGEHHWNVFVDAQSGAILEKADQIIHDSAEATEISLARPRTAPVEGLASFPATDGARYRVFALPLEGPGDGDRTLVENAANPVASPWGWHDTNGAPGPEFTITRGNNAWAYADRDANNVADPGSEPNGGPTLTFDNPLDLNSAPANSQHAFVTNLFYWNNIVHDVFYNYGFDEASGNFQQNNYGKGGAGNDYVLAEAQDGSGRNNANFNTPVDGGTTAARPRMQMFEWRSSAPNPVRITSGALAGQTLYGPMGGFGPSLVDTGAKSGELVYVGRGCDPAYQAGQPLDPYLADATGKIALIDRGSCTFAAKVKKAQVVGAITVIVLNNIPGPATAMGGADNTITIPSIMVSQDDGNLLRTNLPLTATISDGTNGAPDRDSDLDAGVIGHEYGHGISIRLTGGRLTNTCLQGDEQMGEGWSDFVGLVLTAHPSDNRNAARGVGAYVSFEPSDGPGIRPTPYTSNMNVNGSTYDTIKNSAISVPHGVGYVWNTMLWEVYWNLVERHGFNPNVYGKWDTGGNNLAIQLVIDGMKFQPCRPGFVDGRNAILQADAALTGGENECTIWKGFAKRGLGFGATQGLSSSRSDGTQSFAMPPACQAKVEVAPAALSVSLEVAKQATRSLEVKNTGAYDALDLTWTITETVSECATPSELTWVSAAPASGTTAFATSSSVDVAFDSTGIDPATSRSGKLCIVSNDPSKAVVEVPVTLNALYTITGFFGSVANAPAMNAQTAISIVPVLFSLNGDRGLSVFATGSPSTRRVDCSTRAGIGASTGAKTPGAARLTYDATTERYTYPWQTERGWSGTCRELKLTFADGSTKVAYFRFS